MKLAFAVILISSLKSLAPFLWSCCSGEESVYPDKGTVVCRRLPAFALTHFSGSVSVSVCVSD